MKLGTAQTPVEILIDGEFFEIDVTINGRFEHDWQFDDDDVKIEKHFEDCREQIVRKVRIIENKLHFVAGHDPVEELDFSEYGI